ncbi:MAG: cell wall-binding repeat-containing protein [Varibaculum cambriense]|nr:cell wall-binding repeat-containing protein [Varibaculum cambriense]
MIRGLTCFTAAASLILATVPAYAEDGTTLPETQRETPVENSENTSSQQNDSGDSETSGSAPSTVDSASSEESPAPPEPASANLSPQNVRPDVSRLGGKDRVETSVAIARHAYPNPPKVVYLASAITLADAMAAGSLRDGPVVLTYSNYLPGVVEQYLREVNPEKVVALGSAEVVNSQVLQQAKVSNQNLSRLAGDTRVETAIEIAKYAYPQGASRVYVTDGFGDTGKLGPDAIPGAALHDGPILFGKRSIGLTAVTRNTISGLGAKETVQLGRNKLGSFKPSRYLAGSDRYSTSVAISNEVLKNNVNIGYLANGNSLVDGLVAGSLDDGSILLAAKDSLPYAVCEHIRTSKITKVVALGSAGAISQQTLNEANLRARDKSKKCPKPAPPAPARGWHAPGRYLQAVSRVRAPGSTVVPRRGWNGTKVKEVRARLGVGVPLNSGMTFDGRTENAVKRFQRRIRVGANGIVDYRTWVRMTSRSWTMDNFQMRPVSLSANRSQRLQAMLSFARSQIGTPYTWGGAGGWRDGYDCSGLALQALYVAGIDPQPINVIAHAAPTYRSSKQLYAHPRLQRVRFGVRQPGDLIFWQGRGGIYHVAIYLGSNQIIESNYGYARQRGLYNWGSIAPYVVRPLAS